MSSLRVSLIPTGVANLASVAVSFERLGATVEFIEAPHQVLDASHLVLPGVGSFASGMRALAQRGFVEPLRRRIAAGSPTLAICLGFQLLCQASAESPGVPGLGILPETVQRFSLPSRSGGERSRKRVPHLGWNQVRVDSRMSFPSGDAYFAHSYYLPAVLPGWRAAHCTYEEKFVAAAECGSVWGCQFHPELSGNWGAGLLQAWLHAGASSC